MKHAEKISWRRRLYYLSVALVLGMASATAAWAYQRTLETGLERATASDPLAADVNLYYTINGYLLPSGASALDPSGDDFGASLDSIWRQANGSPSGLASISVDTYGRAEAPVIIRNIELDDVSCSRPTEPMTHISIEGGGNYVGLRLAFDLGQSTSGSELPSSETLDGFPEPWALPRQVSQAEGDVFEIEVEPAPQRICEFSIVFDYTSGGASGQVRLVDGDRPFRVGDPGVALTELNAGDLPVR